MFRLCIKHTRAATTNCIRPYNKLDHCHEDIQYTLNLIRNFSTRTKRQSIGLGSSGLKTGEHDTKISELYNDNRLEKLWRDTFERLSVSQYRLRRDRESMEQKYQQPLDKQQHQQHDSLNSGGYQSMYANESSGIGRGSAKKTHEEIGFGSVSQSGKPLFSSDDQHLMKLSFAEGYFYGQENRKKKGSRIVAIIRDYSLFFILVVVAYTLLKGDSPFKVVLGRKFEIQPEETDVSFDDVKGCDEAKQELADIVEFLKEPSKFTRLGGKLPKGVLLVGPPGTGKTLLARAVAGEAGVPFFHASGSEFDEMLVGQGARRVRDLFEKAKQRTPCVIFIDEIDSVGGKRTSSVLHPYANQTINQLLNEMDGFSQMEGVIVIGATNREKDLDQALMRPGRFDVQVRVPVPEYSGRKELIEFYLGKVRASKEIDIDTVCRTTIGLTGADIENIVNQAALKSATDNKDKVTQEAIEYALDKVLMGPERRNLVPDKEQNLLTAYHESGHALVAYYTEKANLLHKVTIVGRNRSLGHTSTLPEKDTNHKTREHLAATIDVCLGGRVAEELIYGTERVTTGAANDLSTANRLATQMVKDFGMSEKVGVRVVQDDTSPYSQVVVNNVSGATSDLVESEIIRLLDESRERVRTLLSEHKNELKLLAESLLKYETLDATEVKLVLEGKDPKASRQERDRRAKLSNLKVSNPPDRIPLDLLK